MTVKSALVVDDSKSARFALRRYLEGHQYKVDAVESADEAFKFLAAHVPSVIFLDHVMPGIDGFDALRSIKADARLAQIPVVICSSNEGPDFNAQARTVGASGVLQKPPNPEQLTRILESLESGKPMPDAASESPAMTPVAEPEHDSMVMPPSTAPHRAPMPGMPTYAASSAETALATGAGPSALSTRDDALIREQLESRLKKVSQGLFVQFAEIKATVAHLANQQNQLVEQQSRVAEQPGAFRTELRSGLDETNQSLRLMTSRVEGLEREVFAQLTAMRTQMETALKTHADRVSDIVQFARQAASEEAQVVAERTVMSAALRISDQLADAILGAVGRR